MNAAREMKVAYLNLEDFNGSQEKTDYISRLISNYDVVFLSEVLSAGATVLDKLVQQKNLHALKSAFAFTHQLYALSKLYRLEPHANAIRTNAVSWSASSSIQDRFLSVKVNGCILIGVHFKSSKGTRTPTFVNEQRQRAMSTFRISNLIRMSTIPVVVFGDFNSRHNENGVLELFKGTSDLFPMKFKHHSNDIDHVFHNVYATLTNADIISPVIYSDHPLITFEINKQTPVVRQFVSKKRRGGGRTLEELLNGK